jgi:3'(2'), 5'-bisphosphate nucleotidase
MDSQPYDIEAVAELARQAGTAIMELYKSARLNNSIEYKHDDSPVTLADFTAHQLITEGLSNLGNTFHILSEEGEKISYEERKHWDSFWLIDPLDGTQEFINQTGNFAVNIGLVRGGYPVAGVIYLPVSQKLYYADKHGAFLREGNAAARKLSLPGKPIANILRAVRSRGNFRPAEQEVLERLGVSQSSPVGSAIKYCMIAEGKADIYYRASPNQEWDSAAGQAIIEHSGGHVLDLQMQRFAYNKPSLVNGPFICLGFSDYSLINTSAFELAL